MMAINHAMTGALIGLSVHEPAAALPLAFLSHFALDAVPHYDPAGDTNEQKIDSRQFFYVQIVTGAVLCFLLALLLASVQPKHWLLAAVCAFFAVSPDLLSVPRFRSVKRTGHDIGDRHLFWRFHSGIQWCTGPRFVLVEFVWFGVSSYVLAHFL